ncbi:MAG TPA: hypothetical protein DD687_04495 [Verrucomicrobiales bacterium]|nr:hypothetical protein [Verrucomicrobiales bacterium]
MNGIKVGSIYEIAAGPSAANSRSIPDQNKTTSSKPLFVENESKLNLPIPIWMACWKVWRPGMTRKEKHGLQLTAWDAQRKFSH